MPVPLCVLDKAALFLWVNFSFPVNLHANRVKITRARLMRVDLANRQSAFAVLAQGSVSIEQRRLKHSNEPAALA